MMYNHTKHLKRIKQFISQKNVKFALINLTNKSNHGYCITSSGSKKIIIVLDPRKEFLATLIHECLHGVYPKLQEKNIRLLEETITKNISQQQIIDLLKHFCNNGKFLTAIESIQEFL